MKILTAFFTGLVLALALAPAQAQSDGAEARRLHELFGRWWEESAKQAPEWSTIRGDRRYDDRLSDASPDAIAAQEEGLRRFLAEARAISRDSLSSVDRVSLDLFIDQCERFLALFAFDGFRRQSISSSFGFQSRFAGLMRMQTADTVQRAEQVLARMAAYPRRVDQEIERVRGAIPLGWVAPKPVLERALRELDGQIAQPPREGPFFEPFRRPAPAIAPAEREALQRRADQAIAEQVLPAQRRLRAFIVDELLPLAPAAGGLLRYPGGSEVYAELVRQNTTTRLTPQQVHDLGLREMAQLREQFAAVQRAMKFEGSFEQFVAHLNGPQYKFSSPTAMLEGYRSVAKRIDPEMPALFAELPRTPYGIRPMPDFLGPGAADNYSPPPAISAGLAGHCRRWWRTRRCRATTCRAPGPARSATCRSSAAMRSMPPTARAGRCTRRRSASASACTTRRKTVSATCRHRRFGRRGWWSIPAFMRSAGAASRRSTTWCARPARACCSSKPRSIATCRTRARRLPTWSAS